MAAVSGSGSEKAIFARLQAGEESALEELFVRYADQLLRVAGALLRDSDAASDVVQDLFVFLWNSRGRYDVPDDVGRYLRRGVRNRALKTMARDETAARARHSVRQDAEQRPFVVNDGPRALELADREAAIATALSQLQPRTREIFLLTRAGLGSGEIADLLAVTPATVYNQLSRAMKLLAVQLAAWNR